jgi:hypothetical protein
MALAFDPRAILLFQEREGCLEYLVSRNPTHFISECDGLTYLRITQSSLASLWDVVLDARNTVAGNRSAERYEFLVSVTQVAQILIVA